MVESTMLADIQWTVYPLGGHPLTACYGAGHGKFVGQRPMFYPLCYAPSHVYRIPTMYIVYIVLVTVLEINFGFLC